MEFGEAATITYLFVTHLFKYVFFVGLLVMPLYMLGRLFNPRKVTKK